jgi:MFS transporter, FHS family, glucose/mannose:H+ symporter
MTGLALGGIGVVSLILARRPPMAAVSVMLAGLGFAAVFPILVGWMTHRFGPSGNRLASWAFVSASLGGATLPWLVGQLANRADDLRVGYGVPLAGILILLVLVPRGAAE